MIFDYKKTMLYALKVSLLFLLVSPFTVQSAHAFEWKNLWSTPEQRALKQLERENFEQLIEQAPDVNWRGVGEFRNGDYAAAAASFAQQREAAALTGTGKAVEQAIYNQANAQTLNENYAQAISLFDEVLASNPDHADAAHNKAIAEQLLEQQQQQQEQQNSDGEQQDGEQQDSEQSDGEQSSEDQQQGDQQQSDQGQGEQQQSQQQDGQQSDASQNGEDGAEQDAGKSDEQKQAEQEAAANAMKAEQERGASEANAGQETIEESGEQGEMAAPDPLTEKEQANEQWLRQIPDDPAGLLQRKLQNRHLTDFPKVKDSVNPW